MIELELGEVLLLTRLIHRLVPLRLELEGVVVVTPGLQLALLGLDWLED